MAKLLERGFALVLREGGGVVTSSAGAAAGEALRIALAQGWLDVRVYREPTRMAILCRLASIVTGEVGRARAGGRWLIGLFDVVR